MCWTDERRTGIIATLAEQLSTGSSAWIVRRNDHESDSIDQKALLKVQDCQAQGRIVRYL
jgi:hypothetical protein